MPVKDIPDAALVNPEVAKAAIEQEGEKDRAGWMDGEILWNRPQRINQYR